MGYGMMLVKSKILYIMICIIGILSLTTGIVYLINDVNYTEMICQYGKTTGSFHSNIEYLFKFDINKKVVNIDYTMIIKDEGSSSKETLEYYCSDYQNKRYIKDCKITNPTEGYIQAKMTANLDSNSKSDLKFSDYKNMTLGTIKIDFQNMGVVCTIL